MCAIFLQAHCDFCQICPPKTHVRKSPHELLKTLPGGLCPGVTCSVTDCCQPRASCADHVCGHGFVDKASKASILSPTSTTNDKTCCDSTTVSNWALLRCPRGPELNMLISHHQPMPYQKLMIMYPAKTSLYRSTARTIHVLETGLTNPTRKRSLVAEPAQQTFAARRRWDLPSAKHRFPCNMAEQRVCVGPLSQATCADMDVCAGDASLVPKQQPPARCSGSLCSSCECCDQRVRCCSKCS